MRRTTAVAAVCGLALGACASGDGAATPVDPTFGAGAGSGSSAACLASNCKSDDQCASCDGGRKTCLTSASRCVACIPGGKNTCLAGQACSSAGSCISSSLACPTDPTGSPTITCEKNSDCGACDPAHQVCDTTSHHCVACVPGDTSQCQSTDVCTANKCSTKCPTSCTSDNDCGACGTGTSFAHACKNHHCTQCSDTYACPAGKTCRPNGVCVAPCGLAGAVSGTCVNDVDCASCSGGATACHVPVNSGHGTCGPAASGCSDLGAGTTSLPPPFNAVTNTCSSDIDCAGVGVQYNVGQLLRDLTGQAGIADATITYGMNACASVTVGNGGQSLSCGLCVPCKADSDCKSIAVDAVAGQALGPLGQVTAAVVLDQLFGNREHSIYMHCDPVAGSYGVCVPCPGVLSDCRTGSSSGGGGTQPATCNHDECVVGGPLLTTCDSCIRAVCTNDPSCCDTAWDKLCVDEVVDYCTTGCTGGTPGGMGGAATDGTCTHDPCSAGGRLDPSCSGCAQMVCAQDSFCCSSSWDDKCSTRAHQLCTQCSTP